jgi:hypothetical protein
MGKHERGLYETLITEALDERLRDLGEGLDARRRDLRAAEAADRVALHLARVVRRAIASVDDDQRVAVSIALARNLIAETDAAIGNSGSIREQLLEAGEVLHAVTKRLPDGKLEAIPEPLIPLLDTTLLTNAPGEPRVGLTS